MRQHTWIMALQPHKQIVMFSNMLLDSNFIELQIKARKKTWAGMWGCMVWDSLGTPELRSHSEPTSSAYPETCSRQTTMMRLRRSRCIPSVLTKVDDGVWQPSRRADTVWIRATKTTEFRDSQGKDPPPLWVQLLFEYEKRWWESERPSASWEISAAV